VSAEVTKLCKWPAVKEKLKKTVCPSLPLNMFTFCRHRHSVCFVRFSEQTLFILLHSISPIALTTETQSLDPDVRTSFEESYINFVLEGVTRI
jgi:hypothetical protein